MSQEGLIKELIDQIKILRTEIEDLKKKKTESKTEYHYHFHREEAYNPFTPIAPYRPYQPYWFGQHTVSNQPILTDSYKVIC